MSNTLCAPITTDFISLQLSFLNIWKCRMKNRLHCTQSCITNRLSITQHTSNKTNTILDANTLFSVYLQLRAKVCTPPWSQSEEFFFFFYNYQITDCTVFGRNIKLSKMSEIKLRRQSNHEANLNRKTDPLEDVIREYLYSIQKGRS